MFRAVIAALTAAFLVFSPQSTSAAQLTSVKRIEQARLPVVQPSWRIPNDRNQVFYLQRSSNSNTVVYGARFDSAGNLDKKNPTQVYWRRFNTDGAVKGLKGVERRFAYGVNVRKRKTPGEFTVTLKPLPQMPLILRQTGSGPAELIATIAGKQARAVYAYVDIDESGLIPKVTRVSLYGYDLATGRAVGEIFRVRGGSINQ